MDSSTYEPVGLASSLPSSPSPEVTSDSSEKQLIGGANKNIPFGNRSSAATDGEKVNLRKDVAVVNMEPEELDEDRSASEADSEDEDERAEVDPKKYSKPRKKTPKRGEEKRRRHHHHHHHKKRKRGRSSGSKDAAVASNEAPEVKPVSMITTITSEPEVSKKSPLSSLPLALPAVNSPFSPTFQQKSEANKEPFTGLNFDIVTIGTKKQKRTSYQQIWTKYVTHTQQSSLFLLSFRWKESGGNR